MRRREFLKYGTGLCVAASTSGLGPMLLRKSAAATEISAEIELRIREVEVELIDGSKVFMLAFEGDGRGPRVPGPVLRVLQGQPVTIVIHNDTDLPHAFAIPGINGSTSATIPPDGNVTVAFTPTATGSYLYLDPVDAPVNRVLGLHGAFIVYPKIGVTAAGQPIPYSNHQLTASVTELFDALGTTAYFPGSSWWYDRERVWVFNQIDPALNQRAAGGERIPPDEFTRSFTPRYFTINGLSGFDAGHDDETVPRGREGEPHLVRTLNAGLATHAPHLHGNDVYQLTGINVTTQRVVLKSNVIALDTWTVPPLHRVDVLLPFRRPNDIPLAAWPPREEPFPFRYPMHCHIEMSQTAGGGNYPQGLVTHWEMLGPLENSAS